MDVSESGNYFLNHPKHQQQNLTKEISQGDLNVYAGTMVKTGNRNQPISKFPDVGAFDPSILRINRPSSVN